MMRSWPRTLVTTSLAALLLVGGGCRRKQTPASEDSPTTAVVGDPLPAAPAELVATLASFGDRGTLLVILRDEGWGDGPGMLAGLATGSSLPGIGEQASSPESLIHRFAAEFDIPIRHGELAGRDTSRPMIASLFEAPVDGAVAVPTAMQPLRDPEFMGLREQLLIPATDVTTLGNSLGDSFGELAAWPELVAGRELAIAWKLDDGFIAALPEDRAIRLIVVHRAVGLDPVEDLAVWQTQLDTTAVTAPDTPALRELGAPENTVAVLLRPWRIRSVITWAGLSDGRRALADSPRDYVAMAVARATEIVLGSELMMPDDNAEFDDWALGVAKIDGALRVHTVASMTELGERAFAAAVANGPAPLKVVADDVVGQLAFSLDIPAGMLPETGSDLIAKLDPKQTTSLWRNCGIGCPMHSLMRMPFGALRALVGTDELFERLEPHQIRGFQVVELARGSDDEPRRGVALLFAPTVELDVDALKLMLDLELGLDLRDMQVTSTKRGLTPVVVFTLGVDPKQVFDLDAPAASTHPVIDGHLDLAKLRGPSSPLDPLGALGSDLSTVSARVSMAGPALIAEIVAAKPDALSFTPDFTSMSWPSPQRSAPPSPGDDCLARVALAVANALRARVEFASAEIPQRLILALGSTESDVACAIEHPQTKAAAHNLRRLLIEALAQHLRERLEFDASAEFLAAACTNTADPKICAMKDSLAAAPKPKLPRSEHMPQCIGDLVEYEWRRGQINGVPLFVSESGIALGDRLLPADGQEIAAAIRATIPNGEPRLDATRLALVVDADVEWTTLEPVFEALAALDYHGFALALRDDEDDLQSMPIGFRGTASFTVAKPEPSAEPSDEEPPMPEPPEQDPPRVVELHLADARVTGPGGKPLTDEVLESFADDTLAEDRNTVAEIEVSATTPWSRVVALATTLCPMRVVLVEE